MCVRPSRRHQGCPQIVAVTARSMTPCQLALPNLRRVVYGPPLNTTHEPRRAGQDWWVLIIGLFIVDGAHFARRGARSPSCSLSSSWRIQAVVLHTQCVGVFVERGAATSFSAGSNGRPSPQGRPPRRR